MYIFALLDYERTTPVQFLCCQFRDGTDADDVVMLSVEHQTCDQEIVRSACGDASLHSNIGPSYSHCASVTMQYNVVLT